MLHIYNYKLETCIAQYSINMQHDTYMYMYAASYIKSVTPSSQLNVEQIVKLILMSWTQFSDKVRRNVQM